MKTKLIILCLIICSILLIGCEQSFQEHVDPKEPQNGSMFVIVENNSYVASYIIVYHRQTKVMYAKSKDGVFTLLVDADGKPMTWKGE